MNRTFEFGELENLEQLASVHQGVVEEEHVRVDGLPEDEGVDGAAHGEFALHDGDGVPVLVDVVAGRWGWLVSWLLC